MKKLDEFGLTKSKCLAQVWRGKFPLIGLKFSDNMGEL